MRKPKYQQKNHKSIRKRRRHSDEQQRLFNKNNRKLLRRPIQLKDQKQPNITKRRIQNVGPEVMDEIQIDHIRKVLKELKNSRVPCDDGVIPNLIKTTR